MATEVTKQPQRLWPRWLIAGSRPVRVDLGPAGAGILVDIGGGGIRVQSLAPLRKGAEVPVHIDIPDKYEPVQCSGIVIWSKPNGAAGIRFTSLSENQRTILRSWLEDLEQAATSPKDPQHQDEFTSIVSKIRAAQLNNADALNLILRRVSEVTAASGAAIALGTPENMVCLAAVGIAPEVGTQIPPGMGLTSECVLRRKMVHCQNTKNDPRVGANAKFGSAVILPLIVNGEVRGALEAFSPRTYAFDSSSIDALEKLADAVVFVTYGIVTQRRLAAGRSPGPPSANSSGIISRTATAAPAATSRPIAPTPVSSQPSSAEETPVTAGAAYTHAPAPASAPQAVASASAAGAPVAAQPISTEPQPIKPRPVEPRRIEPKPAPPNTARFSASDRVGIEASRVQSSRKPVPRFVEEPEPQRSSSSKLVFVAVAVLLLAAVPVYLFVLRPKRAEKVASIAQTTAAAAPQPAIETPAVPAQTPPTQTPIIQTTVPATTAAVAGPIATKNVATAIVKTEKTPAPTEKKSTPVEVVPPKPEPITLSANTGRAPSRIETDAPITAPAAIAGGVVSMSSVPLPSTSAAPKLAPEAASNRTGGALLKKVEPLYPARAKAMNIQGQVELQISIAKDGTVARVSRLNGNSILADAAIDAVKHWRYEPVRLNGQAVEFETTVKLNFAIAH